MTVLAWIIFGTWALASFFVFLTACKKYMEGNTSRALEMFGSLFFSIILLWSIGHLSSQGLLFW